MKICTALLLTAFVASAQAEIVDSTAILLVSPVYPAEAIDKGLEGTVIVCFGINADGHAVDPMVISSTSDIFEQAAVDAALASVFSPTGPSGAETCWRYRFRL